MESDVIGSAALLRAGLLMGLVLLGQAVAARHLPAESIPGVLRGRVALSNRLRPWLVVAAVAMAATGLALGLS